jgi:hypothetical protein
MKTAIKKSDLLSLEEFAKIRPKKRQEMIQMKKKRRVSLGPDVTVHFENYATLWWQIQEMLYIEKGGEEQIEDELSAYNPLVPQGNELVSTIMIEIEDPIQRTKNLAVLGHFEHHLLMRFGPHIIHGVPEEDMERTTETGKTSSVHFIHWPFTPDMISTFKSPGCDVILECTHPRYAHKALVPEEVRSALMGDLTV